MKKILTFLFVVGMIALAIFAINRTPELKSKFESFANIFINENLEPYNQEFSINELRIKNQMFYYNSLSEQNKKVYVSIANGVKNFKNNFIIQEYEIVDNDTTLKDVETAMKAFFADHPEVFYVNNEYTVTTKKSLFGEYIELAITYTVQTKNDLDTEIKKVKEKIDYYVAKAEGKEGIEAELILHDELGKDVKYYDHEGDVPQDCHTIYGAFIKNECVCDGFAKCMQILLDRKNIESIIVTGTLEDESHAWNMVKLNDKWYHLDLTSNKSIKDIKEDVVLHTYFNLTTAQIEKTHKIDNKEILPEANSAEYNYYIYSNKYISTSEIFNSKLRTILDSNENQTLVEFGVFDINNVAEKVVDFLSRNRYNEYVSNNKITYYSLLDSFVLIKTNK